MTAARVLARLHDLGVAAEGRGGRLIIRPASMVPAELLAEIKTAKSELLSLLAANDQPRRDLAAQVLHCAIPANPCEGCSLSVWWQPSFGERWRCDVCDPHPNGWPPARTVDLDERQAIQSEPPLPPLGSPERARLDARHGQMVTGLLAASARRPPSWWHREPHDPPPGIVCVCCRGRRYWSRDRRGWCCATCHPAVPGESVTVFPAG